MESKTILYDLPSKPPCKCWSLNPWKPRLVLNYKKIPYTTQWVEYPDLAPTLSSFGIPPNPEGAPYTSPALYFDGKYLMESKSIAHAIEAFQPSPSLHLDSSYLPKVEANISKFQLPLMPVWLPRVPETLLNPPSAAFFHETRTKRFGMSLGEFQKQKDGLGETPWKEAEPGILAMAALYKENPEGPFVLGKMPSFADFVFVGWLQFLRRIDESIFERFAGYDKVFGELYSASAEWIARDD